MAMTFRRIDEIRKPLDKFKKDNPFFKTDSSIIVEIVNQHHDLAKQLNQALTRISELEDELYEFQEQRDALASALSPFINASESTA